MPENERKVIDKMLIHGGSFVKALAEAYIHADPINRAKIRETWADYWQNYTRMSL